MMWTRSELKQRAKVSFKRCYWSAVAVCFILLVLQFNRQWGYNTDSNLQD